MGVSRLDLLSEHHVAGNLNPTAILFIPFRKKLLKSERKRF